MLRILRLFEPILLVLFAVIFMTDPLHSQDALADRSMDRWSARSEVMSKQGIVATEHPLASQAGAMILAHGGNAVDAAIAANAVMGVVAPMSNGIGGDLFAIVFEAKTGRLYGLNASGWAPQNLTIEFLKSKNLIEKDAAGDPIMPKKGIHTVTVPGAVDGWFALQKRFGSKSVAELLAPAIHYADEGFPITEMVAGRWNAGASLMKKNGPGLITYYPTHMVPKVGEVFRNPDLARSYRMLANEGRDAFYKGSIALSILTVEEEMGGKMSPEDLAEYSSEWVDPISTRYRDWTVYELPPNGQGLAALAMLNIMDAFPLQQFGHNSTNALHVMIEAKKLAYADLLRYVGDPRSTEIPVHGMLSKDYGRVRATQIIPGHANCDVKAGDILPKSASRFAGKPPGSGSDTIYLSVVDRDGNMVSLIQSNYEIFGSGLVAPGTGFALHNRGALFSVDPKSPNVLAGRKRPLHTIIPAFMMHEDVRIAFGIMGGWNQSQAHAQFVSNVVDHGMNVQQAMEAARFTMPDFTGCELLIEDRVPEKVREELKKMGHKFDVRGPYSEQMGGGQAVMRDFKAGVNYAASDPRKDGEAIPEPYKP
jgi:gamma-glutamyltranspeptidase/glutathione hydrolase